ncbi:hypothetical protein SCLCIDRAFT_844394 [Scleroderma citrinum Foug A]|uniref:Uncharacterized protein n=1 Tax=Scleroderma citrinum Foug A TaxID=1036808 RepID=A0A0C3AAY9_9AGAM|nr:hypothetical protein SCLCIDRAFT_844394 [Scleroderma citrinum Foug A]
MHSLTRTCPEDTTTQLSFATGDPSLAGMTCREWRCLFWFCRRLNISRAEQRQGSRPTPLSILQCGHEPPTAAVVGAGTICEHYHVRITLPFVWPVLTRNRVK